MGFVPLPDGKGLLYCPQCPAGRQQKHRCADCFSCQMCSDDRCRMCRGNKQRQPQPDTPAPADKVERDRS